MSELALAQEGRIALLADRGVSPALPYAKIAMIGMALILLLAVAAAARSRLVETAERGEAVSHCHRIATGLHLYSSDCQGNYPYWIVNPDHSISEKASNSNEAFRELFKGGYLESKEELWFGCPRSPFRPGGEISKDPRHLQALAKGENHWALVADLNDCMSGDYPLVMENPVDAHNPPQWNADAAGEAEPGRCWPGAVVVVGFNDTAVKWLPLNARLGSRVELQTPPHSKRNPEGWDWLHDYEGKELRILQVDK